MAKFVNLALVSLLLCGCRKDKVELPYILGEEFAFIIGEWQWKKSILQWELSGPSNFFVHKQQVSNYCTLKFESSGLLTISQNSGVQRINLKSIGLVCTSNNNKIIHFLNETGDVITFYWSEAMECLDTNFNFFELTEYPPCIINYNIKYNSYEKV